MLVWDNHACMPLRPLDDGFLPQLERARNAGVDVITLNIGFGPQPVEDHLRMLAHFRAWLKSNEDKYLLGETVSDIERAKSEGRLAVFFDIEGAGGIDDQLSLVQLYYDLGVRWMLIAYNKNNKVGGGGYGEDCGLTEFGRNFVEEMNRVGMVVCCSHTGAKTAMEAMRHSSDPIIFSHSNAKAVHDHPRNISDELIKACAEKGGVVGVNGIGTFLGDEDNSTQAVIRHIDHMVQLVGPDHVGISLDYVYDLQELEDYLASMKETFPDHPQTVSLVEPERLPEIRRGLESRAYGTDAVEKIMGGNWLRIATEVWR